MGSYDFVVKQGTAGQRLTAILTDADGAPIDITDAEVTFVLRSHTASTPTTEADAEVVTADAGLVSYTLTADDTADAGRFLVEWRYTIGDVVGVWPTEGFQQILIAESLAADGCRRLVSLGDIKEALRLQQFDRSHDARLLQMLDELTPVVECVTGPILRRAYVEFYDGGQSFIDLLRRPVVSVSEVVEWRGTTAHTLTQVATPDLGSEYSYMLDASGLINRRTTGGRVAAFPAGVDAVRVTYTAGYATVPANVAAAVKELVKIHYQNSEQARHPAYGGGIDPSSDYPGSMMLGYFVPNRIREQLIPSRRDPFIV